MRNWKRRELAVIGAMQRIVTPTVMAARMARKRKRMASTLVQRALRLGLLTKKPCERCGATHRIEGHHEDYAQPLVVRWLCKRCHTARHLTLRRDHKKNKAA